MSQRGQTTLSSRQSSWLVKRKVWLSCLLEGHLQKRRLRGAASQYVEVLSWTIASTVRTGGRKLQKFRLGFEVVFSSEKSRLLREVVEFGIKGL